VRKALITILFFAVCPFLLAQQTLTKNSVIKLMKAGFLEESDS
jgi:hypothetical protein